jgi:tRNA-specific 2-thiouridylase
MKVYQPEVVTFCWRNEMLDAKKVCKELKIPFIFLNFEKHYKKHIFDYMINSYQKGETPNPDVFCNKFIKFGAFLETALKHGADKVAMGHYARVNFNHDTEKFELKKGVDTNKDQSYFLSAISQEQLSKSLFPIGELQKKEVREIAEKHGLFTASKKDSQGLCFVGKVNMREFLQNYLSKKEGAVLNIDGQNIGIHEGAVFYTIGERHGFEIFPEFRTPQTPRTFVLEKNMKENTITVGEKNDKNIEKYLDETKIEVSQLSWISVKADFSKEYTAMIRYRGALIPARLENISEKSTLVTFAEPQRSIARGQILVIYDGDVCLGEGVII